MKTKVLLFGLVIILSMAFAAHSNKPFKYPRYFPKPHYNFSANALSNAKIQLGRALFYDPILSIDSSLSCADCHSPYNAFAHTDHPLSHGIHDSIGTRNAPALFNLAWSKHFMWDGAINHLDMQALAPISHPAEMGSSIEVGVQRIATKKIYPGLFGNAFGDSVITGERILKALSQFQLTLVSSNAKYDSVQRKTAQFNAQELKGYELFKTNCSRCHSEPLFTNQGFERNGLAIDPSLNDLGKMNISRNPQDSLLFKVPSLRNLTYTYPYMHDGRFTRLKQVLNHYNVSNLPENPIQLSTHEQTDLIAFLLTLNDLTFVFNPDNQFPKNILLFEKD